MSSSLAGSAAPTFRWCPISVTSSQGPHHPSGDRAGAQRSQGQKRRIDGTAMAGTAHYPTDSSLLAAGSGSCDGASRWSSINSATCAMPSDRGCG